MLNDLLQPNKAIQDAVRYAVNHNICHATTSKAALALVDAIDYYLKNELSVASLQEQYQRIHYGKKPKHLLTGEELTPEEIILLINVAKNYKRARRHKNYHLN